MNSTESAILYDARSVAGLFDIISFTAKDLAALGTPPEPLAGHLTFLDPGWSILRLRKVTSHRGRLFREQFWYDDEAFATAAEPMRYRQVRMEAVGGSFARPFAQQRALLVAGDEVPCARVVAAAMVIHYLAAHERLFPACGVRCLDLDTDGDRILIGDFDSGGFGVYGSPDDCRDEYLGLASARTLP